MEALTKIPLTLESVSQLNNRNQVQQQLLSYKEKVKTFIAYVEKQIQKILQQHQKEIAVLKKQIQSLKKQHHTNNRENFHQQHNEIRSRQFFPAQEMSPIKFRSTGNTFKNFMSDIKSSPYTQFKATYSEEKKEPFDNIYNTRRLHNNDIGFPMDIIDPQQSPGKSRFEVTSHKKKLRRQQVVQYLQSGCKNLDLNTNKLMRLIGRGKPQQDQQQEQIILDQPKKKSKQQELNSSLAAICESLDNSFVSKRSRGKKAKQKQQLQQKAQIAKKKQIEEQKIKKQKGVKNLLQNIRNNINSVQLKFETVKTSKLLTAGQNNKSVGKTSKVMFNPLPVKTQGQQRNRQRSPSLKKTESILKRKSSILTKSLQGISAISMNQC